MKILFAASECAPFIKTGGLGDVAGALPKELAKKGVTIRVVLPYYQKIADAYQDQVEDVTNFEVMVGYRRQYCGIKTLTLAGVQFYFIDNLFYFNRENVYGYYDDGERFAFLQLAIIEMLEKIDYIPDLIHVNDYHTALIPFLLKEKYDWINRYRKIETLLTIHNIEFQGKMSRESMSDLFGIGTERYDDGTARWEDCFNWLKTGILYASRINTVSPSYAEEIKTPEFGSGLDIVLRMESGKLSGITNGIDYQLLNPETDPLLKYHFSSKDLTGKAKNKAWIQEKVGLPIRADVPLLSVISRLTYQKGFNLLIDELDYLMQDDIQLILIGTGDLRFESEFEYYAAKYPDKFIALITFDVALAQEVYAGSDLFLMPSAFEPCGLSQMMSMRYGTLPIVHEVGGLKDTVIPYNPKTHQGTGFGFAEFSSYRFKEAIDKAVNVYQSNPKIWRKLQTQAMTTDFSWDLASQSYQELYQDILG